MPKRTITGANGGRAQGARFTTPPLLDSPAQQRLARHVAPLSQQKRGLTAKEWKFVQELVSGDGEVSLKEAAIRAGYSPASASANGTKLTDPVARPNVVAAIQAYRHQLGLRYGTTFDRHMRDMMRIRDGAVAAGAWGAAVQAEYRRGQALGSIYIERKEIRHGAIDSMSKEEVLKKLAEMRVLYGDPPAAIIDIDPADIHEEPTEEREAADEAAAAELKDIPSLDNVLPDRGNT